eukprot:1347027-Amorphochlora_amoeboformis.AAC.1
MVIMRRLMGLVSSVRSRVAIVGSAEQLRATWTAVANVGVVDAINATFDGVCAQPAEMLSLAGVGPTNRLLAGWIGFFYLHRRLQLELTRHSTRVVGVRHQVGVILIERILLDEEVEVGAEEELKL